MSSRCYIRKFAISAVPIAALLIARTGNAQGVETVQDTAAMRTAQNSIFLELGGAGGLYTINYERLFGESGVSFRVGLGYMGWDVSTSVDGSATASKASWFAVPILANYYLGNPN